MSTSARPAARTWLQVLHETGRDASARSWMWVQAGGPPDSPVVLFNYRTSRAQDVPWTCSMAIAAI